MDLTKVIQIIESCATYQQFLTAQQMVEQLEFSSEGECEKIREVLINKEKQFTNGKN